jgi:uncharacterized protein (TIGR04141 family)
MPAPKTRSKRDAGLLPTASPAADVALVPTVVTAGGAETPAPDAPAADAALVPTVVTLTAYLLKSTYTTSTSALRESLVANLDHDVIPALGDLYTQASRPHPPKWVAFFGSALTERRLLSSSASGVLIVQRGARLLAVTFGYGRALLEPGTWEEGFGLRVTLNSIDPSKMRSIDHKTFDAVTRHSRTQTSRDGSTTDFGLDIERDLVRAVTGEPADPTLGKRLMGMDALVFTANVDAAGLPALLDRYLDRYQAKDYKANFQWIDNIAEVRDLTVVSKLDASLVARLKAETYDRLWLSIPDIVDWSAVGGFKYKRSDAEVHPDLHCNDFVASVLDPATITAKFLHQRRVFVLDKDEGRVLEEWPVYRCFYCEEDQGNDTYLLTGGKWYRVEMSFAADVNKSVAALVSPTPVLPNYDAADADETAYNKRVALLSNGTVALMDRQLIFHGGGQSKFEFCDLYSTTKEMIHVKRYGGSSGPLSHLFSQGLNSAQMWLGDIAFRKKVNARLPSSHKVSDSSKKPDASGFPVVFAVVSRSAKDIDKSLPFFSRLALRNAARQLQMLGYPVTLVKIKCS